jgi:hypothetical protein
MLVANPRKQKLTIQVKDSIGLTDITIGTGEVNLSKFECVQKASFLQCHLYLIYTTVSTMHRWKTGE